ncbi:MAG: right-handed parallel beta-helix repeat-containing protein [Prolixibacteraceae bacterium]
MRSLILTFAGTFLLLLSTSFLSAQSYYVDPINGNDNNSGTAWDAPLKTITKAQEKVRSANTTMNSDIYVYLRGGDYNLTSTLTFTGQDGGKNGFKVIYKAYNAEKPIITGGKQINGWTQVAGKNYFVANVPTAAGFAGYFRNLWVDGKRAIQAKSGWITTHAMTYNDPNTTQERDGYIVKSSDLKDYTNLSDMRIFQCGVFKHVEIPVEAIVSLTTTEKAIKMKQPNFFDWSKNHMFKTSDVIRVINAFEELDEPGEFYLNRDIQKVYYYPRAGENMNTAKVIAPAVEILLKIQGASGNVVTNLQFEGIAFQYGNLTSPATREIGRSQADLYSDYTAIEGQIQLQYSENITFKKCRFEHLASSGIYLPDNTNNTLIEGNIFNDLTAAAILIGKDMNPSATVNNNTTISNNVIRSIGADFFQASGIYANVSKNLTITHNDVADVAYFGINQRYSLVNTTYVGNTQITYNKVSNYATASRYGFGIGDEVAGIYFFGVQDSKVSRNYVQYSGNKRIAAAYRQDQLAKNITWDNNVADCKTVARSFSWHTQQPYGGIAFDNNFSNVAGEFIATTGCSNTNFHLESSAPAWSSAAQFIIDEAGLETPYRSLLNEFGPDIYDFSEVPTLVDVAWSTDLWNYLVAQRLPYAISINNWRQTSEDSPSAVSLASGEIKLAGAYTATFRGAIYGNETIKLKLRFTETGSGKQTVITRVKNSYGDKGYSTQADYQVVFTPTSIQLFRNNSDGTKTTLIGSGGLVGNTITNKTSLYGPEAQLVEIGTFNQANGVQLNLKVNGATLFDVQDNVSGFLTHPGYVLFNNSLSTGTIYISDSPISTGINEKKTNTSKLRIFPNPLRNQDLTVSFDGFESNKLFHLSITDLSGLKIYQTLVTPSNPELCSISINRKVFRSGLYIVKAENTQGVIAISKVVVY